jgi:DNA-directed RNA polymerase subunit RPC12/RpoP
MSEEDDDDLTEIECDQCGSVNDGDAAYCSACGAELPDDDSDDDSDGEEADDEDGEQLEVDPDAITAQMEALGGVCSPPMAAYLVGCDATYAREFAEENDLPRAGVTYVFHADDVIALAEECADAD